MDNIKELLFKRHKLSEKLHDVNFELKRELSELKCTLQQKIFEHVKNGNNNVDLCVWYFSNEPQDDKHVTLLNDMITDLAYSLEISPSVFEYGWNIYINRASHHYMIILAWEKHYGDYQLNHKDCSPIYKINGRKNDRKRNFNL